MSRKKKTLSRRQFVAQSTGAVAAFTIVPRYVLGGAGYVAPSEKLNIAVIGCGGVGLSAINGAAIAGAGRIIAVDINGSKLNLAKHFGATDVVNAADTDPVEAVKELTGGGVAYSFEALGRKETSEQAFRMLRTGGVATIIGMVPQGQMMEIEAAELLYDRKLQGSNMGSNSFRVDMPKFVEFYLDGKLKLDEMISRRIKLEQINEAFEEMKAGEVARSVITFDH